MSETKTERERAATRVTIVLTILGVLVLVADLAWMALTTQRSEDEDVAWSDAAWATVRRTSGPPESSS